MCSVPVALVLVREDHVLDDLFPGETREFMNRGIIPMTVCRDYLTQRLQRYPVSVITLTSFDVAGAWQTCHCLSCFAVLHSVIGECDWSYELNCVYHE